MKIADKFTISGILRNEYVDDLVVTFIQCKGSFKLQYCDAQCHL